MDQPLPPRVAAAAALLLLGLPAPAQQPSRVSLDLPYVDVDVKTEHWVAPLKDGLAPSDLSHLSLDERRAYDAAGRRPPELGESNARGEDSGRQKQLEANRRTVIANTERFHQLDVDGAGTLWVHGGTYKASFDAEGATYIPFLGSRAPQNFPLTFSLLDATLGGEPLATARDAAPRFEGHAAVYERGSFVERYETRFGAMEQLFVFDTLPAAGELAVRLAVTTELLGADVADGLAWSNSFGTVTYSEAVAIDANGRCNAVSTTLVDGVVELRVPSEFVADAALPLTIDPLFFTFLPNNANNVNDYEPDIAYDLTNNRYLIVWNREFSATDHDTWSELFDVTNGFPIVGSGQYIDFTTSSWTGAKVANNRSQSQFLVVASRTSGASVEIWGRTREAESNTQSSQFQISSGSGAKLAPDVGGDPFPGAAAWYCVVWERVFNIGVDHDIHAQLVGTNAALQGNLISIDNTGSTWDRFPSISKSNGNVGDARWNLAWERQFSPSDWDVRGAQIRYDGDIVAPSFSVDFSSALDLRPDASSPLDPIGGDLTYMIAYQRLDGADWDIYASVLRVATRFTHDNLSQLWVFGANLDEGSPSVDTDGKHFAVGYNRLFHAPSQDWDAFVASAYLSGDQIRPGDLPITTANSFQFEGYTEVCAHHSAGPGPTSSQCGLVWHRWDGTQGNIEAAVYVLPAGFGQLGGNYCAANTNSTGRRGSLRVSGSNHRAFNDLVLEATLLPLNATCFFLTSASQGFVANAGASAGNLCLGGAIGRYVGPGQVKNTGSAGQASLRLDLGQHPTATGLVSVSAGQTWNFQAWHRDTTSGGVLTSNFTDAATVVFQ